MITIVVLLQTCCAADTLWNVYNPCSLPGTFLCEPHARHVSRLDFDFTVQILLINGDSKPLLTDLLQLTRQINYNNYVSNFMHFKFPRGFNVNFKCGRLKLLFIDFHFLGPEIPEWKFTSDSQKVIWKEPPLINLLL